MPNTIRLYRVLRASPEKPNGQPERISRYPETFTPYQQAGKAQATHSSNTSCIGM